MKKTLDLAAMKMRSRMTEAAALRDSLGLGLFEVFIWNIRNQNWTITGSIALKFFTYCEASGSDQIEEQVVRI